MCGNTNLDSKVNISIEERHLSFDRRSRISSIDPGSHHSEAYISESPVGDIS